MSGISDLRIKIRDRVAKSLSFFIQCLILRLEVRDLRIAFLYLLGEAAPQQSEVITVMITQLITSDVSSRPDGATSCRLSTQKRVVLLGSSSICGARIAN